jgi:MoaD family protein
MATIKLKTFSVVRDVIGSDVVEIEVGAPATVRGLFDELFNRYGEPLKKKFFLPGSSPGSGDMVAFLMRLNDEAITSTSDMNRELKNGDEIAVIFPIGGG